MKRHKVRKMYGVWVYRCMFCTTRKATIQFLHVFTMLAKHLDTCSKGPVVLGSLQAAIDGIESSELRTVRDSESRRVPSSGDVCMSAPIDHQDGRWFTSAVV